MPRVVFEPIGRTVEVAAGTSVLDAARLAGITVRNDCGGRGACGRCIVRLQSGKVHRLTTRYQLSAGEALACRLLVLESDVVVFVPRSSLEVAGEVTVGPTVPRPREFPPPDALIRRTALAVSPPSLEDNSPDVDRLVRSLRDWREGAYEVPLDVLRDLPGALREADWRPEVTLAAAPGGSSVLGVGRGPLATPCILAVDVGTTALKAQLLTARVGRSASCYNSQVMYGPDVISRIVYCQQNEEGLARMQELVVRDVNRLVAGLLAESGVSRLEIWAVVASGNTTMMHLLLGMDPLWIRREPYVGCSYRHEPVRAAEVGLDVHPLGPLFCLPSVSAYVGGDITAGVLATGLSEAAEPTMLIDLGTNGEIVVGNRDFMVCCSASAGPAFEGEASASGTRARPGAIDSLRWDGHTVHWQTIGGRPPIGICGSGYIDLLAVLLRRGVIDRTGRFREGSSRRLRSSEGDALEYVLAYGEDVAGDRDIVLTQADIDNLVRAKGAIYAAATILLESLGLSWQNLARIMLAGGFGDSMDKENAVTIGLLPDVERDKIEFVGNTSLQGAVMAALDERSYVAVGAVARQMTYMELSTHPKYMSEFVAACFLPHTDAEEFPSVRVASSAGTSALSERR